MGAKQSGLDKAYETVKGVLGTPVDLTASGRKTLPKQLESMDAAFKSPGGEILFINSAKEAEGWKKISRREGVKKMLTPELKATVRTYKDDTFLVSFSRSVSSNSRGGSTKSKLGGFKNVKLASPIKPDVLARLSSVASALSNENAKHE